ncbi:MAG: APC family permease [Candidatus Acidiferrales bacterium]
MAEKTTGEMKPTLGLTGLTVNAMALIAPGAFLWLTFAPQATEGATAPSMWIGILFATLLCLATAVSYAEMAKLYPGTGSSYYFAEQSFLNHDKAWKYARLMKFIVGWGSHLYYWIYPGVMVAVTGVFCGYIVGTLYPNFMSASNPGPMFMMAVAIVFSFGVSYIAHRGVTGSTGVSLAVNIIQIVALLTFSIMAIHYRAAHPPGSVAWQWDATTSDAYNCEFAVDAQNNIVRDSNMIPQCKKDAGGTPVPYHVSYPWNDSSGNFLSHPNASSVVGLHKFQWMFVQATVAILILVGFESVTSLGGEAKNAKRDVPIAVITSLLIQGCFCYLFEYFATNYVLSSGYTMQNATGSAAPIGDLMVMVGDAVFGAGHGRTFMLIEAVTVFLALIGTTLSCINTGARVTYAMGKDSEVPEHFGMLHDKNLSPHKAIWTLAVVSAVFGVLALLMLFGDGGALPDATIKALPHGFWSSFGYVSHDAMAKMPNSLLTITLASNFGTFLLYGLSCVTCIFCYQGHPNFSIVRHLLIPLFGVAANLICMGAYLVLPFMGYGTKMEPFLALGIAGVWAIYGGIYFTLNSKKQGRTTLVTART